MVAPAVDSPAAREEDPGRVDLDRAVAWSVDWVKRRDPVRWALGAMVAAWAAIFFYLGALRHVRFGTFGFDLGIYDQGIWLLSRFRSPFVTVKGLNIFGHHMNPILVLLVPFYWLGAGPLFLLLVQVVAQASGALAIYLLARERLADRWLAVALAGVLLLNPTYQFQVWNFFHPDALAIAPLLFAYWAARSGRWRWFALAAVVAVACKEDVAPAMAVIGLLIWARGDRTIGLVTAFASMLWFVLSTKLIMPQVLGGLKPFYDSYFADLGATSGAVARTIATHPGRAIGLAARPDRISYFRMMLAPVGFLALAAPTTLLIALPMMAVNALTSFPYAREIRYHYSSLVIAGILLATVEAIARLGRENAGCRRFLVGAVVATSLATTVAWGPSPVSTQFRSGLWPLGREDARNDAKRVAVALLPDGAVVSSTYYFVPQLDHRPKIYEFPEPWKAVNWGIHGERLHDPANVDWLLLDRGLFNDFDRKLIGRLLDDQFTVRFDRDDILLAERVRPGGRIEILS